MHDRDKSIVTFFLTPKNEIDKKNKGNRPKKKANMIEPTELDEIDRRNNETESQTPFYWEKHMQANLSVQEIKKRLMAMSRHGFDWNILESLDMLQIHSLISHCDLGDCDYPESFPRNNIPNFYSNQGPHLKIPRISAE
jgi:hypothetical protein